MMADTPDSEAAPPGSPAIRFTATVLKYLGSYLLGIFLCVVLTPVEFELAGRLLLPFYLTHSLYGFVIWAFLAGGTSLSFFAWIVWMVFLLPFLGGAFAIFGRSARLRSWHPFWIAFPIGFVGTAALYCAGSQSI